MRAIAPRFSLGSLYLTPGAKDALQSSQESPFPYLAQHSHLDPGILAPEDSAQNEQSLRDGSRIFSAYRLNNGTKIWVITEAANANARRESTTILLPEEY